MSTVTGRISATPAAHRAILDLCAARGPVMFVQSAGCCAGSVPMCYPAGEFLVGDLDVLLGEVADCPFYIDRRLDDALGAGRYVLDVAPGEAPGFSLPAGAGRHFVTVAGPPCHDLTREEPAAP